MVAAENTPRNTLLAMAALAFTVAVWGLTPAYIRSFALTVGPGESLIIRNALVSVLYLAFLPFFGGWHIARSDWSRLALVSFIGMLGYNLGSIYGFFYAPAGIGGLIVATQPLLVALLAAVTGKERLSAVAVLGIFISLIGSVILFWEDEAAIRPSNDILFGSILIFLSGIAWSVYLVFSKSLIQTYGTYKISALTMVLAFLPVLPMASVETLHVVLNLDASSLMDLFYLVVVATFLALMTWNHATGVLRPTQVAASLYLVPILAVASGYFLLDEKVTGRTILAGSVILAGVAVAQFGNRIRFHR